VHGHGILHLQTSNQSPETFHLGIVLVFVVAVVVAVDEAVDVAAISPYNLSDILALYL
jgi:hypothetical protein